jgi:hypothetical protein
VGVQLYRPPHCPLVTIGYAAFFSDVKHGATPVVSGHRVTLTYNLYFDGDDGRGPAPCRRLDLGTCLGNRMSKFPVALSRRSSRIRSSFRMAICSALGCGTYIRSKAVEGSAVCSRGRRNRVSSRPTHLGSSPCCACTTSRSQWRTSCRDWVYCRVILRAVKR